MSESFTSVPAPGPHGGDGAAVATALGLDPADMLDLSQSLNPFAPDLATLLAKHHAAIGRYPHTGKATDALAETIGVDPSRLLLTNGGSEAIALVAAELGGRPLSEPDFALYPRNDDGPVWRSDPHSPSGTLAAPHEVADVWDEAFYQMATGTWSSGRAGVIVGSLTKLFACAGLRLGYLISDDVGRFGRHQPAWSVGSLGLALLPDLLAVADLPAWHAEIAAARGALCAALTERGFEVRAADAPWVLVNAPGLREQLAPRGVLVRDCASFDMAGWVRIAVPNDQGLTRLLDALDRRHDSTAPATTQRSQAQPSQAGPQTGHDLALSSTGRKTGGALLVVGATSGAGKSTVTAALCRALQRRGERVAPFKAQNMSNHTAVTVDGGEVGRAQAMQALAAGVDLDRRHNPVLLKPSKLRGSHVVVLGDEQSTTDAVNYGAVAQTLKPVVLDALDSLRGEVDWLVAEGAGGAGEINLLDRDLVNLPLAVAAGIPAVLVVDIDRGGAYASAYGTIELVPEPMRRQIRGVIFNRFRGDPSLLTKGNDEFFARTGVPVLGVLPYLGDTPLLGEEDSLDLSDFHRVPSRSDRPVRVAVVRLPHLANPSDFDPLTIEPDVHLWWATQADHLTNADLIVIPGSRATVADLDWLRAASIDTAIASRIAEGDVTVLGVCAGYQMLGTIIDDPIESGQVGVPGLGLLSAVTTFASPKIVRQSSGVVAGHAIAGFQIRFGRPTAQHGTPWLTLDGQHEGEVGFNGAVKGTSLHSLFDCDAFRAHVLTDVAARAGRHYRPATTTYAQALEAQHERLADWLEAHVDFDTLIDIAATATPAGEGPGW